MSMIKHDARCAEEISNNIRRIKPRLEIKNFQFSGYLTSRNVEDDTTCNLAYGGGINELKSVESEVSRTASFIDEISYTLNLVEDGCIIMNREPLNLEDNIK